MGVAEPTIVLLSTSDTDLISARSSGRNYRWANPSRLSDEELPDLLADASIVVVRILGGYRAWQSGIDTVIASGIPTVLVSGEQAADAELTGLSTLSAGIAVQAHIYLAHGGVENLRQLHAFLSDTVLMTGVGFTEPVVTPTWGELERPQSQNADGPTIAVLYYRAQHLAGNTAYIESLCAAIEDAGARPLPVYCASLRTAEPELLQRLGNADAMVVTVLAAGGLKPATVSAGGDDDSWNVEHLAALDIPILQGLCLTSSRSQWCENDDGLSPLDVASQVAVPEFDGRIITVPFSFKEIDDDGLIAYVADPERCARVAGLAVRHAQLRYIAPADKRVALVFSAYPTKHARIGNAVGLDTPASAVALLRAMRDRGYQVGDLPGVDANDGDALIHALIERGGPGPRLAHRRAIGRQSDQGVRQGLPRLVRHPARRIPRRHRTALGPGARGSVRRSHQRSRRRDRHRRNAIRQPGSAGAAAPRVRRESRRHLPRPRLTAQPPLPGRLPLAGRRIRIPRGGASGQARQPRVAAGQDAGHVGGLRIRRRAGQPAVDLPVPRQRSRRGHPGQEAGTRSARRPPHPSDGTRRKLWRHRAFGTAARRTRQRRRPGPRQATRHPPADLDADPGRQDGPRPGPDRAAGRRHVRRHDPARRRLAVRDQRCPDPRRPTHSRAKANGGTRTRPGAGHPAGPPAIRRRACTAGSATSTRSRRRRHRRSDQGRSNRGRGTRLGRVAASQRLGSRCGPTTHRQCRGRRGAAVRGHRSGAPTRRHRLRDRADIAGAGRPVHCGRPVRVSAARPGQRAAHRSQLLLRRPQGDTVPAGLGSRCCAC